MTPRTTALRTAARLVPVALSLLAVQAVASVGLSGEVDVFDRPTAPVFGGGQPVLVLYASRNTEAAVTPSSTELAERLADVPYVTLVRVDLRDVPGLFHGIARTIIRSSHTRSVDRTVERETKAGRPVERDRLGARLRLVADSDGHSHAAVGLAEGFERPLAIVIDPAGRELVRGTLPEDREAIGAALAAFRPLTAAVP